MLFQFKTWQILTFIIGHLLFSFLYWVFLSLTYFDRADAGGQVIISYFIRIILFIPTYWILFKKFYNVSIWKKILLHLTIGPLYAWLNYLIFGWLCYFFKVKSLGGNYSNWDIFVPLMIYVIQYSIIHAYDFFSRLKIQIRMEAELKALALQAELSALKAQIHPHFLFNTLNSINATIPKEQEQTRELVGQLADVFRFTLHASLQEYVNSEDEIQFIKSYLALEQRRFEDKLTINYEIDLNDSAYLIPPMLLQPILENAMKHGVATSLNKVTINFKMKRHNSNIQIAISDTGTGIGNIKKETLFSKGTGLKNVQQRLLTQFGKGIKIEDNQPSGLIFSFTIPAIKA